MPYQTSDLLPDVPFDKILHERTLKDADHRAQDEENKPFQKNLGLCVYCFACKGLPAEAQCRGCFEPLYCCGSCRDSDNWIHSLLCGGGEAERHRPQEHDPQTNEQQRTKSEVRRVRVILFPTDSQRPRWDWLEICEHQGARRTLKQFFDSPAATYELCRQNNFCSPDLRLRTQPICMIHATKYRAQGINQATKCLVSSGFEGCGCDWLGPLLFVGTEGDLTMRDFRWVADWLQCHPRNYALLDPNRYFGKISEAAKLNCEEAKARLGHQSQTVYVTPAIIEDKEREMEAYNECASGLWRLFAADTRYYCHRGDGRLPHERSFRPILGALGGGIHRDTRYSQMTQGGILVGLDRIIHSYEKFPFCSVADWFQHGMAIGTVFVHRGHLNLSIYEHYNLCKQLNKFLEASWVLDAQGARMFVSKQLKRWMETEKLIDMSEGWTRYRVGQTSANEGQTDHTPYP